MSKRPESAILQSCLTYLQAKGIPATRHQCGQIHRGPLNINLGRPGWPDIIGVLPDGLFLGVECKTEKGTQRPTQIKMQGIIEATRGTYIVARSSKDLHEQLSAKGYEL